MKYFTLFFIPIILFSCAENHKEIDKNQLLYSVLNRCLIESPGMNLSYHPIPERDSVTGEIISIIQKSPLKESKSKFYIDPQLFNIHFLGDLHIWGYSKY